jgi:hypothetical protein
MDQCQGESNPIRDFPQGRARCCADAAFFRFALGCLGGTRAKEHCSAPCGGYPGCSQVPRLAPWATPFRPDGLERPMPHSFPRTWHPARTVGQVCNLRRVGNPPESLVNRPPAPVDNRRAGYNPAPHSMDGVRHAEKYVALGYRDSCKSCLFPLRPQTRYNVI